MKKKIVIASINPVKIKVVRRVFAVAVPRESFEIISLDLEKRGAEPVGKEETLEQIRKALVEARRQIPDAQYYIAMEGGVEDDGKNMEEVAYVIVQDSDSNEGISRAVSFPIPFVIAVQVREKVSFADAVDSFFKRQGTKQVGGFVKILTEGLVTKEELYYQPTAVAFARLIKKEWFV